MQTRFLALVILVSAFSVQAQDPLPPPPPLVTTPEVAVPGRTCADDQDCAKGFGCTGSRSLGNGQWASGTCQSLGGGGACAATSDCRGGFVCAGYENLGGGNWSLGTCQPPRVRSRVSTQPKPKPAPRVAAAAPRPPAPVAAPPVVPREPPPPILDPVTGLALTWTNRASFFVGARGGVAFPPGAVGLAPNATIELGVAPPTGFGFGVRAMWMSNPPGVPFLGLKPAEYGFGALADFRYYIETVEPLIIYPTIAVGFLAGPERSTLQNAALPLLNLGVGAKVKFGNLYATFEFGVSGFTIPYVGIAIGYDGDSKITKEAERLRMAAKTAPAAAPAPEVVAVPTPAPAPAPVPAPVAPAAPVPAATP